MSIHHATITTILDGFNVPAELQDDPELRAAAYALAFLDDPAQGAEERFYDRHHLARGHTRCDALRGQQPGTADRDL